MTIQNERQIASTAHQVEGESTDSQVEGESTDSPLEGESTDSQIQRELTDFQVQFEFSTDKNWVNTRNPKNITALQQAAIWILEGEMHHEQSQVTQGVRVLKTLLESGADPSLNIPNNHNATEAEKDTYGWNAIGFAASQGIIHAFQIMRDTHPDCIYAPTGDKQLFTPVLLLAQRLDRPINNVYDEKSQEDCKNILSDLVAGGTYDINLPLPDTSTIIEYCTRNNRPNATKFLIELGASLDTSTGYNIAHIVAAENATEVFSVIKDSHPELFMEQAKDGLTPLMLAIKRGNTQMVDFILNTKWQSDAPLYNGNPLKELLNPEYRMDKATKVKITKILISSLTFNPFELDRAGQTMMHDLINLGDIEACIMLIEKMRHNNIVLNKANLGGKTYLSQAVLDDAFSIENLKKLLESNPSILNETNIQYSFDRNTKEFIMQTRAIPVPEGFKTSFSSEDIHEYNGVPLPTNYIIDPSNPTTFTVPVSDTAFTIACKNIKVEKAEFLSEQPNFLPFTNNTGSTNIHHASLANFQTVHNCAMKEPKSLNQKNCMGDTPLDMILHIFLASSEDQETKNKIVELLFHGAQVTSAVIEKVTNAELLSEFNNLVKHVTEIHHSLHPCDPVDFVGSVVEELTL